MDTSIRSLFTGCMILSVVTMAQSTALVKTSCPLKHYALMNANGDAVMACQPCSSCPPGFGVLTNCSATEDTVCEVCAVGTFSFTRSHVESCTPCRKCPAGGELEGCSLTSDTVCKKECERKFYYDPATGECERCSYCFPRNKFAQTVRVEDCRRQSLDVDFQCSPLPPADSSNSWSPPVMVDVSNHRHRRPGSHVRARMGTMSHGRIPHANDGRSDIMSFEADIALGDVLDNDDERLTPISISTSTPLLSTTADEIDDVWYPYDSVYVEYEPKTAQQQNESSFLSLSSSQMIWIVVIAALSSGLLSFIVTAAVCCQLKGTGKCGSSKVTTTTKTNRPINAWTYQDLIPPATEELPLVETPPQTRKMTCV